MLPTMAEVKARKMATICTTCGQNEWESKCEVKEGYHLHCTPPGVLEARNAAIRSANAAEDAAAEAGLTAAAEAKLADGYRATTPTGGGLIVWYMDPRKGRIKVGEWAEKRTGTAYNLYGDAMSEYVGTYGLLPTMPIPFPLAVALRLVKLTSTLAQW